MDALNPKAGEVILDVGCGAGQTVLQLAERVGAEGRVIGVDIAPALLDLARTRTASLPQVWFAEADAQTHDLPSEVFDAVYSRFGVMAFADPVAAFINLRRMLKPLGRLAFVCWRSLAENELDHLPLRAAQLEPLLDPTPFSFEGEAVIRRTLTAAGFSGVSVTAHDAAVGSGSADAMLQVLLRVGPLGKILRERPALREAAEPRVRAALAGRDALKAAVWVVTAQA